MNWPDKLQINAWAGPDDSNESAVNPGLVTRFLGLPNPEYTQLLAPDIANPAHWWDARIGWGVVLPDYPELEDIEKARLTDKDPEPLHRLLAHRKNAPILRYAKDQPFGTLRRYYKDAAPQDIAFAAPVFGVGHGEMPQYLMLCGAPSDLPWSLQFDLQLSCHVGRVDLPSDALDTYIGALCNDWGDSAVDSNAMTIWSVAHNATDITELMLDTVAAPLNDAFTKDTQYTPTFLKRDEATLDALYHTLQSTRPGLVVTTSHGKTGPLHDVPKMRGQLGMIVDQARAALAPQDLLGKWQPNGAIWYAHACCAAGTSSQSNFTPYVDQNGDVYRILKGLERCGSMTAPLPQTLLGAEHPLRAFIGHVEPTFNWTLMDTTTHQYLTRPIIETLYAGLFSGMPVGLALDSCRRTTAALTSAFLNNKNDYDDGVDNAGTLLRLQLAAQDWRTLVIHGDPAVTLSGIGGP